MIPRAFENFRAQFLAYPANTSVHQVLHRLIDREKVLLTNELLFTFLGLAVSAKGSVAFFVAVAVSLLILAVAWRLVWGP